MAAEAGVVVVGAGLAGDTAVAELRALGFSGAITLVGDEAERPYDRPPLSKGVLLSEAEERKVFLRSEAWYADNGVGLRLGQACAAIDPAGWAVTLTSGETLAFSKLLIATGASGRRLPSLEAGPVPIRYLRDLADARRLRADLRPGAEVVVVGGGVIGLEIAASAVQRGCTVTVVEGMDRVMARCVAPRVSEFLHGYHQARGARILCGARLAAVQDRPGALRLEDGTALPADVAVVGIGARPNTALAEAAGLKVEDGVVVDRQTRTSHPDIHAAGDVTRFEGAQGYARAEHWRHAIDQATVAAKVMAGGEDAYVAQPWIWSDQYDLNIQVTGEARGETEALRGDPAENAFILFHLVRGRVVGATSVNQARHKRAITALVSGRVEADPAELADPRLDLKTLAARMALA